MPTDVLGPRSDEALMRFVRDVVVVEIESASGDAVRRRERVQLVQVVVAHQMSPQPAVGRPPRIVDQDAHVQILSAAQRGGA